MTDMILLAVVWFLWDIASQLKNIAEQLKEK